MKDEKIEALRSHNTWVLDGIEIIDNVLKYTLPTLESFLSVVPLNQEEKRLLEETKKAFETVRLKYREAFIPINAIKVEDNFDLSMYKHLRINHEGSEWAIKTFQLVNRICDVFQRYVRTGLYKFRDKDHYDFRLSKCLFNLRLS